MRRQRQPSITQSFRRITADFFTRSYRLSATAFVTHSLINMLSEESTQYLNLMDIYVSRIEKPGEIIRSDPRGTLKVEDLLFILPPYDAKNVIYNANPTPTQTKISIFATLPSFEVEGDYIWRIDRNVNEILTDTTRRFAPVFQAVVRSSLVPKVYFQGEMIIINRAKIELLSVARH